MNTALYGAAESGDLFEVQRILKDNPGIEVDAVNDIGDTPLSIAVGRSYKDIIEVLLAHGAAVNGRVGARYAPLQKACFSDKADIVSLLIEHGADVDATTVDDRRTSLTIACRKYSNLGIVQLLINAGADVNGGDGVIAPFHWAAYTRNTEAIELLIQSGADVNILSTEEHWFASWEHSSSYCCPIWQAGQHHSVTCSWCRS